MEKLIEAILHNIPFMALLTTPRPANRPLATRLSEQAMVAILSSFAATFLTLYISNDRNEAKIATILESLKEIKSELISERLVAQDVAINKVRIDVIERKHILEDARNK